MQYLSVYCPLTLHHVIECTPNWTCNIERTVVNKNSGVCWNVVARMICIDNRNGFIELTNIYRINYNFSYFSTKTSHVTGNILNWGSLVADIAHIDVRCSIIILRKNLNLTQNSCKLTEKCFSYIIKELLNSYWWILAGVNCEKARDCECIFTANSCQYSPISIQ